MADKNYMESLLTSSKNICEILFHGTIESSTKKINDSMNQSLFNALNVQNEIYNKMATYGWYTPDLVQSKDIENTLHKVATN